MNVPLGPIDDASTPLTDEEREGLIPSYITLRGELNEAEQAGILKTEQWAFSRKRNVLDQKFLNDLADSYNKCNSLSQKELIGLPTNLSRNQMNYTVSQYQHSSNEERFYICNGLLESVTQKVLQIRLHEIHRQSVEKYDETDLESQKCIPIIRPAISNRTSSVMNV